MTGMICIVFDLKKIVQLSIYILVSIFVKHPIFNLPLLLIMYFSWQLDITQPVLCTTITNAARINAPEDNETLDVDNTGTANITE